MNMKNLIITLSALFSLVLLTHARAASVDYVLDQSNALADDIDYLSVSISDATPGQLDFRVETLAVLADMAGGNYGIQSFGFNFSALAGLTTADFLLPEDWRVQYNKNMSEAGRFDVRIMGTGNARQDPLVFSVLGLTLVDVEAGFATHVAGFMEFEGHPGVTSAFFFGDRLVSATVVPVPAAVWLFGSGLLGLIGIARRKKAA